MPRPFPITINYVFPGGQPKGRALHRTHGFVERGNWTLLDECFRVAGVLQSLEGNHRVTASRAGCLLGPQEALGLIERLLIVRS